MTDCYMSSGFLPECRLLPYLQNSPVIGRRVNPYISLMKERASLIVNLILKTDTSLSSNCFMFKFPSPL